MKIIDAHIHITKFSLLNDGAFKFMALNDFFRDNWRELESNPSFLAGIMDEEGVEKAVLLNYAAPETLGYTEEVNEFIYNYSREYPDKFIPFGGLDLKRYGRKEIRRRLEELFSKYEIKGIKLQPVHQLFYPNQYVSEYGGNRMEQLYDLYQFCEDNNLPITIHTGTSMFPMARIKYGDPIYLDDVAVDFKRLKVIMAHGGRPFWTQTAFFLLRRHKDNMVLDISGIPPQNLLNYFPRLSEIATNVIFGSDWPSPGVKSMRYNADMVAKLPLDEHVKQAILYENFKRIIL